MGSTNAQDLEQALQGEYHGRESLLTRKLHLFFHLALLMEPNGSKCSLIHTQYFFKKKYWFSLEKSLWCINYISHIYNLIVPYESSISGPWIRVILIHFTWQILTAPRISAALELYIFISIYMLGNSYLYSSSKWQ